MPVYVYVCVCGMYVYACMQYSYTHKIVRACVCMQVFSRALMCLYCVMLTFFWGIVKSNPVSLEFQDSDSHLQRQITPSIGQRHAKLR